jgi:hypothetical protein
MPDYIVDLERMQAAQVGVNARDEESAMELALAEVVEEDWTVTYMPHQAYAKRCVDE